MKKPEISFRPYSGSGPLSIYWSSGPYGDAIEAVNGEGVSWHSPNPDVASSNCKSIGFIKS